jgi:hypothetical protein
MGNQGNHISLVRMKTCKRFLFLFFSILICTTLTQAQQTELVMSVFNNAIAFPFSGKAGVIHKPFHPGVMVGVSRQINKNAHHQLHAGIKSAYFYQQLVQHGIQVYPEIGYRFSSKIGIILESRMGAGYMLSIPDIDQFSLNENGQYQKEKNIRSSLLVSLSPVAGYDLRKRTKIPALVFMQYQLAFQTPYVKSYVPVLPNSAFHIGTAIFIGKN